MDSVQNQKQVIILLVAIVVLLAAVVGALVWRNSTALPPVSQSPAVSPDPNSNADPGTGGAPAGGTGTTGMPPITGASPEAFDPATAPKVPADQTPEEYVKAYYGLCEKGDYTAAFPMLPAATQQYYGDEAKFKGTLESYGITGFEVSAQQTAGDKITVVGTQQTPQMAVSYTWSFVKGADGGWLVEARQMGGS